MMPLWGFDHRSRTFIRENTEQKMFLFAANRSTFAVTCRIICYCTKYEVSVKDFCSKCDQIRRKLQSYSHLHKKSLLLNLFVCCCFFLTCVIYMWNFFNTNFYFSQDFHCHDHTFIIRAKYFLKILYIYFCIFLTLFNFMSLTSPLHFVIAVYLVSRLNKVNFSSVSLQLEQNFDCYIKKSNFKNFTKRNELCNSRISVFYLNIIFRYCSPLERNYKN